MKDINVSNRNVPSGTLLFQIDLPTEEPVGGGFYSRGFVFAYSIEPASTLNWTVTPTDGGPVLTE